MFSNLCVECVGLVFFVGCISVSVLWSCLYGKESHELDVVSKCKSHGMRGKPAYQNLQPDIK